MAARRTPGEGGSERRREAGSHAARRSACDLLDHGDAVRLRRVHPARDVGRVAARDSAVTPLRKRWMSEGEEFEIAPPPLLSVAIRETLATKHQSHKTGTLSAVPLIIAPCSHSQSRS